MSPGPIATGYNHNGEQRLRIVLQYLNEIRDLILQRLDRIDARDSRMEERLNLLEIQRRKKEAQKPWQSYGVSRRTWQRWKASGRLQTN